MKHMKILETINLEQKISKKDAFKEIPNGATLTESNIDEYIKKEVLKKAN